MNTKNLRDQGFTLIELLIVIVIIGILSGVLIGVINPARQQARSRNATIQSTISKVGFAINSARAGVGSLPTNNTLSAELENVTTVPTAGGRCPASATAMSCNFTVAGITLPATCTTDYATGVNGTNQCEFRYVGDTTLNSNMFIVAAKKFALASADAQQIYYYHSTLGMYECPGATALSATATSVPTGCTAVVN